MINAKYLAKLFYVTVSIKYPSLTSDPTPFEYNLVDHLLKILRKAVNSHVFDFSHEATLDYDSDHDTDYCDESDDDDDNSPPLSIKNESFTVSYMQNVLEYSKNGLNR